MREDLTQGGRRFLLKQGSVSVACELDLTGMDDLVAVLSGRARTVRLMERLIAELGTAPRPLARSLPTTMAPGGGAEMSQHTRWPGPWLGSTLPCEREHRRAR